MALSTSNGGGFAATGDLADSGIAQLPIFNVEPVQLAFSIAADFVAAQVANNVLILALSTGRILRIDLERPEDIDGRCIAPLLIDPAGPVHCLVGCHSLLSLLTGHYL